MKKIAIVLILFSLPFLLFSCTNTNTHQHNFVDGVCSCGEMQLIDIKYTLTFIDYDGSIIEEVTISKGGKVIPPANPTRGGYDFIGWDHDLTNIDDNLVINALYQLHEHEFVDGVCSCGEIEVVNIYTITFKDYDGTVLDIIKVVEGDSITLPNNPTRFGYTFIGWDHSLDIITSDLEVIALYEKDQIIVGFNQLYQTLSEALEYVSDGDIIYIKEGTYEGCMINKSIEIRGNNYNASPNKTRNEESTFTTDLIINASNVTINGIELTGDAKITFDNLTSDVENINIVYSKVNNSTVNINHHRDRAPFNFVSNNGYFIKNIIVDNCYFEMVNEGLPMAMYIIDLIDLKITNSFFYGGMTKGAYNDCIKVDDDANSKATFGIKGNVTIQDNVFKNYSQYAIWFRQFSSGNYLIENNYFDNIGQTVSKHAAVNFIKGSDIEQIEINVLNNKIVNGCLMFRIDSLDANINKAICNVNNNALCRSTNTYYITNSVDGLTLNAQSNYYDTAEPDENKFLGSINYSNYYSDYYDLPGTKYIELTYETTPYVYVDDNIKVNYEFYGFEASDIVWTTSNQSIATVDSQGVVTGHLSGTVEVKVRVNGLDLEKTIIVNVYENDYNNQDLEVIDFLLSIMNSYSYSSTAANSRTNYAVTNPYYYSIYRSATTYLFEDLVIDSTSFVRIGDEKLANNKVEYVTIHDTWAMPVTSKELAKYFLTDETSIHYTVGNDGIYQVVPLTDKAKHAGDSPYRAYALDKTDVLATTKNPIITLEDGYFTINGIKTALRPYTDYEGTIFDTTNYKTEQLTYSGIRCVIGEDGYYYLGKTYYNTTYKTVCNFGGNANSIGIEMGSEKGTDFYLNMHRTAKVVAYLMETFDLTRDDIKMHNYFSGKNCAQLLKNNLKYELNYLIDQHNIEDTLWDEFLNLCEVELEMRKILKKYQIEFISDDTSLISDTGRIINHNIESECATYTIKVTNLETLEVFELHSSIIIPSIVNIDQSYLY